MAKHLEIGDQLHGIHGAPVVEKIAPIPGEQEAYNLVIDGFNTYFVSGSAVLVHDNTFRKPTTARVPGLID